MQLFTLISFILLVTSFVHSLPLGGTTNFLTPRTTGSEAVSVGTEAVESAWKLLWVDGAPVLNKEALTVLRIAVKAKPEAADEVGQAAWQQARDYARTWLYSWNEIVPGTDKVKAKQAKVAQNLWKEVDPERQKAIKVAKIATGVAVGTGAAAGVVVGGTVGGVEIAQNAGRNYNAQKQSVTEHR